MTLADLLILAVLAISVVSALVKGFFVEVFSIAGIFLGLLFAAAYYPVPAHWLTRWVKNPDVASLSGFLMIALAVMLLAGLLGRWIRSAVHQVGLGFVDRLLGAVFGFVKGCALVILVIMAITAFLPRSDWLKNSRLVPFFLTAAHQGARITPQELEEKIRQGIQLLRTVPPEGWKPSAGAGP